MRNKKTRIIALSGISSALAVICVIGVAYFGWAGLVLAVMATIAVSLPTIVSNKYVGYSLICYVVTTILAVWIGFSGIHRVAPLVIYALPVGIIKSYGESIKVIQHIGQEDFAPVKTRQRIPTIWRWVLYYVLCEIALGMTALVMYLFMPEVLNAMMDKNWHWYLLAIGQLIVPAYNILLNGCFNVAKRVTNKYFAE